MARTKSGKEWEVASYSLDKETKEMIKEMAGFEGMSQSEFLSFLTKNWDAGINPTNKLNLLLNDRKKLSNQLEEIEKQITIITKQIKLFEDWKKQKNQKKGKAVEILKRIILNKEFEETERIARTWQRITGIPAIELIAEASDQIRRSGI